MRPISPITLMRERRILAKAMLKMGPAWTPILA